jgi:hypothetical protein
MKNLRAGIREVAACSRRYAWRVRKDKERAKKRKSKE